MPTLVTLPIDGAFMQIASDIIILFAFGANDSNRLLAWNWITGTLLFDIDSNWSTLSFPLKPKLPLLTKSILDFAWLTPRSFLLSDRDSGGSLNVCMFDSGVQPGEPRCIAALLMPDVCEGVEVLELNTHSNALIGGTPPGEGIWTADQDSRIHVIHITYSTGRASQNQTSWKVLMVVHQRVFLRCLAEYGEPRSGKDAGVPRIPWEQWGPSCCRIIGTGDSVPPFAWLR